MGFEAIASFAMAGMSGKVTLPAIYSRGVSSPGIFIKICFGQQSCAPPVFGIYASSLHDGLATVEVPITFYG